MTVCDFTCEWVLLPVGDIHKYKYKYKKVHYFAPARHAHCRIPCPLDMDCSLSASLWPNMLFASANHARALHAHNKLWLLWKTRKGQWARTCATSHAVTKSAGPSFGITCNA